VPQVGGDEELIRQLSSSADPRGFFGRYYCLGCRSLWRSVELPVEFLESLLACRPKLEELKREIARLRFVLANQRQVGAQVREADLQAPSELHRKAA
jgi:hypothetical protein